MPPRPDGRVNRVNLGVQHVVIVQIGVGIHDSRVRLEEDVVQRDCIRVRLVGEVRVGVDEEGRLGDGVEVEDGLDEDGEILAEGAGGGRVGVPQHVQGVGAGDVHLRLQAERDQSLVNRFHGGEEVGHQSGVVAFEHFVADGDAGDLGVGEVGQDVLLQPSQGGRGVRHRRHVLVADPDHELDVGVEEGAEHVLVRVVQFHSADVEGAEEARDSTGGRQVVRDLPVVDAHRHAQNYSDDLTCKDEEEANNC